MKKFLKSPWTISFATALFSLILTIAYDFLKGKQALSTIKAIVFIVINSLTAFLNFELKVWWVLLGLLILILIFVVFRKVALQIKKSEKPNFTNYTEDIFDSWKWTWQWYYNELEKKWSVTEIEAHCPNCDTAMFHERYGSSYKCPRCGFNAFYNPNRKNSYDIEAIVIDNVKRGKIGKENET